MCGFAGYLTPSGGKADAMRTLASRMASALIHRGPDDQGVWVQEQSGVALAHRRLSILDLSERGHQPMVSADGRYMIVYNGEVYNFPELRAELEGSGCSFVGGSDTEVVLAAISRWGVKTAVQRFNGMFAFAVWDCQERRLVLGRDRIGIKPLYYAWAKDGAFLVASEIKALREYPAFDKEIDLDALSRYFRHGYIPGPATIFAGVRKLPPGTLLTVDAAGLKRRECAVSSYWSVVDEWQAAQRKPWAGSESDAIEAVEQLLGDSVQRRMISDVPLGVFLSGGIDSSVVASLAQARSGKPIQTFSIGFSDDAYNEAPMAKAVATHLKTDHTELYMSAEDVLEHMPAIPNHWDEPFSDPSQVPMYLVCRLARKQVTVALSGDGGDELFSGYDRYAATQALWRKVTRLPGGLRGIAAGMLGVMPPRVLTAFDAMLRPALKAMTKAKRPAHLLQRIKELMGAREFHEFYGWANSRKLPPEGVVAGRDVIAPVFTEEVSWGMDTWSDMSLLDMQTYLPDDILVKADRASMAVGLEARVPLLDHRVVEMAARLPETFKVGEGVGKRILRQVLYRHVPQHLVDRPKMGFGIPLAEWLRGPLRDWAEELLSEKGLRQAGYLLHKPIRKAWTDHLSGKKDYRQLLWSVLVFQAWREKWK